MNYPVKNKVLVWAVMILLVANIATIGAFWLGRFKPSQHAPEQPADFLISELHFDSLQKATFLQLVKNHRKKVQGLQEDIKKAKDGFFDLLQQPKIADSSKKIAATSISNLTRELDLLTFDHFQRVRNICNADQQKKFDTVIKDVMNSLGRAQRGGQRRPNRPPPDREGGPPPR